MASGGSNEEESNHQAVLNRFEELGFTVCFQKVCPSKCGIPMTRQRLHYIGISNHRVPGAASKMGKLKEVWSGLLQSKYTDHPLSEFLEEIPPKQNRPGEIADLPLSATDHPEKKKWVHQHKEVFERFEAQRGGNWKGTSSIGKE